jgi:hypothetical protein
MSVTLQQYIEGKKAPKKIKKDIQNRWDERVVPNGVHNAGARAFQMYAGLGFANNIGVDKCLDFAWCAMANGAPEAANSFFRQAARMEGVELSDAGNTGDIRQAVVDFQARHPAAEATRYCDFPDSRQPGRFNPMQPTDALYDRINYINDDRYWGQPKKDGSKLIIFATPDRVWYQSREGNLREPFDLETDDAFRSVARILKAYVLEGELVFFSADGQEWMTAAEATKWNMKIGEPGRLPVMAYVPFICNWRYNDDLETYGRMVEVGDRITNWVITAGSRIVQPMFTARTNTEKSMLASLQEVEQREGEVWFAHDMPYTSGKNALDNFVRTKYVHEIEVRITGCTQSSNPAYAFGALNMESMDGEPLGQVGTGFSIEQRWELLKLLENNGPFLAEVRYQRKTAEGQLRHARFLKVAF